MKGNHVVRCKRQAHEQYVNLQSLSTHERETMFTKIAAAMLKYCRNIITIRNIQDFVHVKAIMTDLTSHCVRQFQEFLSPDCHLGHTLYHTTACIQKNLFKDKDLRKLFYKDASARGYMRSLMYTSFSSKSIISDVYEFLKFCLLHRAKDSHQVFKTLERHVINSTKIPFHNLSYENKVEHRNEPTEAHHKV